LIEPLEDRTLMVLRYTSRSITTDGMEIKLKIGAISRDNSEYCHYAIPENQAKDREKPRKISRIRAWGDRAEISPTPNIG